MTDEPILEDLPTEDANKSPDTWVMPEPVFRTSGGRTPKNTKSEFDADDIPTEIANRNESEVVVPQPDLSAENADEIAEVASEAKPKRGFAKSLLVFVCLIGVVAAAVIIALIYFLFYFRSAETGTF